MSERDIEFVSLCKIIDNRSVCAGVGLIAEEIEKKVLREGSRMASDWSINHVCFELTPSGCDLECGEIWGSRFCDRSQIELACRLAVISGLDAFSMAHGRRLSIRVRRLVGKSVCDESQMGFHLAARIAVARIVGQSYDLVLPLLGWSEQ